MLRELYIRNIALISELRLSFKEGFNVLSGETGAGKSIIVDSIGLISGDRGGRELISTGSETAYVEALFDMSEALIPYFEENGIPSDDSVIITRELNEGGRSVCRVNGRMQTLQSTQFIANALINIYGQNQLGEILDRHNHIELLDQFGGEETKSLRDKVSKVYEEYTGIKKEIERLNISESERARMLDMYSFQAKEIEDAGLKEGEDEELRKRSQELTNAEKIATYVNNAYDSLSDKALTYLGNAVSALESASRYSERAEGIYQAVQDAYYVLEDQGFELARLKDGMYFSEDELNEIEERRHLVNSLMRKYGGSVEEVLRYYGGIKGKLTELENASDNLEILKDRLKKAEKKLEDASQELRKARMRYAVGFENEVVRQLRDLGMENSVFDVRFTEKGYSKDGTDDIEFMITVNRGEPLKPLVKVVSGGEASRIMLALKTISAEKDGIDTLIFDEIDTGISGRMAVTVAEKIASISRVRQVICVTHLPQIAAMADTNFFIEKLSSEEKTWTTVRELSGEEKEEEVARLSGGSVTVNALEHARELIAEADKKKKA